MLCFIFFCRKYKFYQKTSFITTKNSLGYFSFKSRHSHTSLLFNGSKILKSFDKAALRNSIFISKSLKGLVSFVFNDTAFLTLMIPYGQTLFTLKYTPAELKPMVNDWKYNWCLKSLTKLPSKCRSSWFVFCVLKYMPETYLLYIYCIFIYFPETYFNLLTYLYLNIYI